MSLAADMWPGRVEFGTFPYHGNNESKGNRKSFHAIEREILGHLNNSLTNLQLNGVTKYVQKTLEQLELAKSLFQEQQVRTADSKN